MAETPQKHTSHRAAEPQVQTRQTRHPSATTKLRQDLGAVSERVTRIEDLVSKGATLETALAIVGVTPGEIREKLDIPAPVELTLAVITAALAKQSIRYGIRFEALIRALGYEEDKNGVFVPKSIERALKAGASGGDKSFYEYMVSHGRKHDEVVKMLAIAHETSEKEGLTNEELFFELAGSYNSFRARTDAHLEEHDDAIERLTTVSTENTAQLTSILGSEKGKLNLPGRLSAVEKSHGELYQKVETIQKESFPFVGIVLGSILGFLGFLWWLNHNWGGGTHTETSTVQTRAGTARVTNTLTSHPVAAHWYWAVLFGVAIAAVIIGFSLSAGNRSKTTTETQVKSSDPNRSYVGSITSRFREGRERAKARRATKREQAMAKRAEERRDGSEFVRTHSNDANDGRTKDLPVVDEERNYERQKVS